jgi:hypothetical protein
VSRLDSDDRFAPRAIDGWLESAQSGADVVIAPLSIGGAAPIHAPLTRPFRHRRLDPVRDRLAYRTAPFGLIRRRYLEALGVRYTPRLQVGEDLELGLALWNGSARVDFAHTAPPYIVEDDARERTTEVTRPLADELEASRRLLHLAWFEALPEPRRRAIVVKLARIHLLEAIRRRATSTWDRDDREVLITTLAAFDRVGGHWRRPFSIAERAVLDAASDRAVTGIEFGELVSRRPSRLESLLAPGISANLDRESTLRRRVRYQLPL